MKLAILGPSPVPFTVGGVENMLWGLCESINQKTSHQAELIKLPSREYDFWSLIENYYAFYNLDLSHFDTVICTKYPSWMVEHKCCIYYIPHRLRGLYDTYHFTGLPTEVRRGDVYIDTILDYMEANPTPKNLNQYFKILLDLKKHVIDIPKEFFDFPAPFIRKIVHYMDSYGMSQSNSIDNFFAISNTVKNRKEYFPPGANVKVIHLPSYLKEFTAGDYKHIFFVSRLDGPKRIDMLIQAMQYVKSNIMLYIAGTGPQEKQLKDMSKHDVRIKFLGFINDAEVDRYYADSLVIPYFPYDEDYGLITIEAMMHKKPVITTEDSGGPTEFVVNGETGFCTKFNAKAIGEKIDYLANNPKEAERMGVQAYEKVKDITWENTVKQLLEGFANKNATKTSERRKLTVTSTFPIYPPEGGGQARIFNLYKNVAKELDVEILSFTNADQREYHGFIAENLKEIRIPKSEQHQQREWSEFDSKAGIPVSDIAMLSLSGETPKYGALLKESIIKSDLVIISHPYLYYEAKKHMGEIKFIYEAHNVESDMKKRMIPNSSIGKKLVQQVFEAEKECCEKSELIMTCSYEDKVTLSNIYNVPSDKILVVPNGVDCNETYFTSVKNRLENKRKLDIGNEKIGLFMGSWHGPNLEACEKIFEIASKCPCVKFLLMGSQCGYFKNRKTPGNVGLLGLVSQEKKHLIFETVDFALNPMLSGSGTNLKMFDYMAAGIPIITTEFGTRGIDNKEFFLLSDIANMHTAISDFTLGNREERILLARKYVEQAFDWSVIAKDFIKNLELMKTIN